MGIETLMDIWDICEYLVAVLYVVPHSPSCSEKQSRDGSMNGILLCHKKEHIWISSGEVMNLEPVIQSEMSPKEKNKYHILMLIYGI